MPGIERARSQYRFRVKNPKEFDKRSFRVKPIGRTKHHGEPCVSIIVGCPKGKWDSEKEECKVGTQMQALRFERDCFDKQGVKSWIKRNICKKKPSLCRGMGI